LKAIKIKKIKENNMYKVKIAIDTNFHHFGPTRPTVSPFVISYFNISRGDTVIGFQDDQEWEAVVGFDSTYPEEMEWFLELTGSKEFAVLKEREEGRDEGWSAACPIGELNGEVAVVTAMLADGIDIERIFKYTRLSRTRLNNIKRRLAEKQSEQ
jgi:hypothetical protein